MGLGQQLGLDEGDNNLGLEEGGLILHEDGRKRKATKLLGNNLDTNDIMADTSTLISPVGSQDEMELSGPSRTLG